MTFDEYQEKSNKTATYDESASRLFYLGLGIADEAGEVAGKLKKFIRDNGVKSFEDLTDLQKEDLMKEVGDVLWYAAQLARQCDYKFSEVAQMNIEKLYSRLDRGKLSGSGDNR